MQKTVARAFQLLDFMAGDKTWYGVSELSQGLDLYKSNIYQLLSTCEHFGYVEQDSETKKYALSMKFVEIAHKVRLRFKFHDVLGTLMRELSDETGELSYFAIPYHGEVLYLCGAFPKSAISAKPVVGLTAPLYCNVMGKVILAYSNENLLEDVLSKPMKAKSENTIVDKEKFILEIERVRLNGFAEDNMEEEFGIKGLAVPVITDENELFGALCLSGPSARFTKDLYPDLVFRLKQTAQKITSSGVHNIV